MTDPTRPHARPAALVTRALLIACLLALANPAGAAHAAPRAAPAANATTPIDHFVFLMQENHTFDNYFGTRPGVDGIPPGTCMPIRRGQPEPCVKPFHLGELGSLDLDHTAEAFRVQYHNGRMDGFVEGVSTQGKDGRLAMAYYDDRDLPYYWNVADEYVLFDRFFSSSNSGSIRNHMFRVTGGPGATGASESIPAQGWGDIPTIFDRL
jgi:phospholipase C